KKDQAKIDELRAEQKKYRDQALQDQATANNILDRAGDKVKDDFIAMSNNDIEPRELVLGPPDSLAADFSAPENLTGDIFRTTNQPIYNENNTIPVDQTTKGLVYKVQVGAFRQE